MTVRRGPFKSVYAGHAALHSIGTGLILTLSHSLPVSIFLLSGSLPVYSCTIRLTAVYSLTVRLTACLLSLVYVFMHSQSHSLWPHNQISSSKYQLLQDIDNLSDVLSCLSICSCSYPSSRLDWLLSDLALSDLPT